MKVPERSQKFVLKEVFFSDSNETEEDLENDDDNIDCDQVLSLVNSKLLLDIIIQVKLSIFFELVLNGKSSPDKVKQRIFDCENKYNGYYQQILDSKNWSKCWVNARWNTLEYDSWVTIYSEIVGLNIILYNNSLDSGECYYSINN